MYGITIAIATSLVSLINYQIEVAVLSDHLAKLLNDSLFTRNLSDQLFNHFLLF